MNNYTIGNSMAFNKEHVDIFHLYLRGNGEVFCVGLNIHEIFATGNIKKKIFLKINQYVFRTLEGKAEKKSYFICAKVVVIYPGLILFRRQNINVKNT